MRSECFSGPEPRHFVILHTRTGTRTAWNYPKVHLIRLDALVGDHNCYYGNCDCR